jgi:hypothetical protein
MEIYIHPLVNYTLSSQVVSQATCLTISSPSSGAYKQPPNLFLFQQVCSATIKLISKHNEVCHVLMKEKGQLPKRATTNEIGCKGY